MRKATLVLATSVAFLLFGASTSYAGTKKSVQIPSASSVANGSGVPVKSGNKLSIPGALQGEFIPGESPTKSTPFKVLPTLDFSIPRTISQAKNLLKVNPGSIAISGVVAGLLAGLDWVMDPVNSQITKKETTLSGVPISSTYLNKSPQTLCSTVPASQALNKINIFTFGSSTYAVTVKHNSGQAIPGYPLFVNNCTSSSLGYSTQGGNSPVSGAKLISSSDLQVGYIPLVDSDFGLIDAYVNARDSNWVRDLIKESCNGSLAPDRCYQDLVDFSTLSGPSTVSGPSSLSTTTGPNGTTTKETKTNFQITYGSDYFIYAPTTTTTTVNPDGTTEVETEEETSEEETPEEEIDTSIPDLYKPVIDKYDSISGEVEDAQGPGPGINWGPWYSFGGSCTEIEAELPIIGYWTTNYCPYIYNLVRPVLMFIFVMLTWHYCKEMFQEAIEKGRPV